jgi:hypothetical protein
LKLKHDEPNTIFAFSFDLRRFTEEHAAQAIDDYAHDGEAVQFETS